MIKLNFVSCPCYRLILSDAINHQLISCGLQNAFMVNDIESLTVCLCLLFAERDLLGVVPMTARTANDSEAKPKSSTLTNDIGERRKWEKRKQSSITSANCKLSI